MISVLSSLCFCQDADTPKPQKINSQIIYTVSPTYPKPYPTFLPYNP